MLVDKKKSLTIFFSFLAYGFNLSASIIKKKTHSALCLTQTSNFSSRYKFIYKTHIDIKILDERSVQKDVNTV